ncbi:MAG: hypothetical protein K2X07_03825 [Caulobacteraceae bacterium]|nr:hypothetical protein [Caulobacteraceae bacterium]
MTLRVRRLFRVLAKVFLFGGATAAALVFLVAYFGVGLPEGESASFWHSAIPALVVLFWSVLTGSLLLLISKLGAEPSGSRKAV